MEPEKVSVIIPTYNRFRYVKRAIESVKQQTYKNLEIIVVNDCSTQIEYYEDNWEGVSIIHLPVNSRQLFGYPSAALARNKGSEVATGTYIAYLDDDDIWFPRKLELQLNLMKETGTKLSCSDGLIGRGIYDPNKLYEKYNAEHFYKEILAIFHRKGSSLVDNGFPQIWNSEFVNVHNCIICSSVVIEKKLLQQIGYMRCLPNGQEDYDCWRRAIPHTNCSYVKDVCFYYDMGHGDGQNY